MEPLEIQNLMSVLQSPSLDMDKDTVDSALKACAVVEDLCTERCRHVIKIAHKSPVLQVYMSDGWSCDMRSRQRTVHDDMQFINDSRMRIEFLVQRCLLKCKRGSDWHFAVKVQRPRPLATKKCADIWCAAAEFCPVLALSGHTGIGIHCYIQDGLFSKPFGKRMVARHSIFWEKAHCPLTFSNEAEVS